MKPKIAIIIANYYKEISDGLILLFTRCLILSTITRVLPVPGPATTRTGPEGGEAAASNCIAFNAPVSSWLVSFLVSILLLTTHIS